MFRVGLVGVRLRLSQSSRHHREAEPADDFARVLVSRNLVRLSEEQNAEGMGRVETLRHRLHLAKDDHQVRTVEPRWWRWRRGGSYGMGSRPRNRNRSAAIPVATNSTDRVPT